MSTASRRGNLEGSNPVQRKDGRWQVNLRYTDDRGVWKRVSVTGKTPADARRLAKAMRQRLDAGQPARDRKITLATFATGWIDSTLAASDRKATTKANYSTLTKNLIVGASIGQVSLDKLRPSHIEAWKVELQNRGLSQSTIRSAYTILRAILDGAVRDEALGKNPAAAIPRPKVERHEAAYLEVDQVRQLITAASGSRYQQLFELLAQTGLRRGEALALHWKDVDFDQQLLKVRGTLARVDGALAVTEPKTAKSVRVLHLSAGAARVLKSVRSRQRQERLHAGSAWVQTGFVFTTEDGQPCDPRNALRALKAAAKKTGLGHIGLHTLRHSAATVMLENDVPLKVVSEILGHHSVSITGDIYGHVSPRVASDAMAKLDAALSG